MEIDEEGEGWIGRFDIDYRVFLKKPNADQGRTGFVELVWAFRSDCSDWF